jgi:hypothetical protein
MTEMEKRDDQLCCWWRWRFQPVVALWRHLGVDYAYENPAGGGEFKLRHVDYGVPGDRSNRQYRHRIALYRAMVGPCGQGWPPLRTPYGRVFGASAFRAAPRDVADYLMRGLPRVWGPRGGYRTFGPNRNTGLRLALRTCTQVTGYDFGRPPLRIRLRACRWDCPFSLPAADGPYPGYFEHPN